MTSLNNPMAAIMGYSIFQNSPDCIFVIEIVENTNTKFKYTMFNQTAENLFGVKKQQILGKYVEEVFNEEIARLLNNKYLNCCEKKIPISYEEELDLPSGYVCFYTSLIPIKDDLGKIERIVGIARDITEQKELEDSIKYRVALQGTVAKSSGLFISAEYVNVNEVLKMMGEVVSVHRAYIFELRENGIKMDNVFEWCSPGTEPQIDNLQGLDSNIFPWWMDKLRAGENIVINDVDSLPVFAASEKEILKAQEIKALLVVPINSTDGQLQGFMGFDDTETCRQWCDEDAEALRMVAEMIGVYWERQRVENKLRETNQLLQQIIDSLPDATLVIDRNKKVIAWNRAIEEMTGLTKEDILSEGDYAYAIPFCGEKRPILIDHIFADSGEKKKRYSLSEKNVKELYYESFVPGLFGGKGAFIWATASPLFDRENNIIGVIESIRDVTERKRMEDKLQYLATHDTLTNIPNRYYLEETLKRAAARAKRGNKSALLFLDIDNFKLINDTLGHKTGDEVLIMLVGIIKANLREGDFFSRIGGDEFAVLLDGISGQQDVSIVAERLRKAVCDNELCFIAYELQLNLSVSIGIVLIDGLTEYQRYLSLADIALYKAKEGGRNRISFARQDEDLTGNLTATSRLIGLLKTALHDNLFELNYQPIVKVSNQKVYHYEVLLRLRDNNGQVIMPGRFIPVAEKYGLMPQIDLWVVKMALKTLKDIPETNLFVNISGATLGDETVLDEIELSIKSSGISPARIGFEITETAVVKDIFRAERWIRRIKDLGCLFALDDFGTGFASFSYLRILPVNFIKIDGSFVHDLDKEPAQRAIIQAIHNIAYALNKKTIVEFVENETILNILKLIGVDYGQGFHLGKPDKHI